MKKIACLTLMFWIALLSFHLQAQELLGAWQNQLGSTLVLTEVDDETGFIKGHYTSPVGTDGEAYPLVGWINSKPPEDGKHQVKVVITFSVRWGEYGSVTSWAGTYEERDGIPTITTMWLLARPTADASYSHIMNGSDVFRLMGEGER